MQILRETTSITVEIGPFVDATDGYTPEDGLTISQADVRLSKNGGAFAQSHDAGGATNDENGWYYLTLDTTDTDTIGRLDVAIYESDARPVHREYMVIDAGIYDALVSGTAYFPSDVRQIASAAGTVDTLVSFMALDSELDAISLKIAGAVAATGLLYETVIPIASLDTFPADGGPPPPGGNWTAIPTLTALEVSGGKLVSGGAGAARGCYWSAATFGNDAAAYIQISTVSTTTSDYIVLLLGYDTATGNGYGVKVTIDAAHPVEIVRFDGGAPSVIGNGSPRAPVADMWIALRRQGDVLAAYIMDTDRGGWVLVSSAHDDTYVAGGRFGVLILNTEWELDDFGGCNVDAIDEIVAGKIATDSITAAKIADGSIDAATFAAGAITAASIATGAIDDDAVATDLDTYQAKVWLIDDNSGGDDRYAVVFFLNSQPVTAGITTPTLWVFSMEAVPADLVGTSGAPQALTQAGATGTYFHDEAANRIADGTAYLARIQATIGGATRTWYQPVGRDSYV